MTNPLIIERPDMQTRIQKLGRISLAIFMWSLWLYLWLPLAIIGLWLLGINITYTEAVIAKNAEEMFYSVANFAAIVLGIVTIQYTWSLYNYLRFRNKTRRNSTQALDNSKLAQSTATNEAYLWCIQHQRLVEIQHDKAGNIVERSLKTDSPTSPENTTRNRHGTYSAPSIPAPRSITEP